jgi:hypothetical protein
MYDRRSNYNNSLKMHQAQLGDENPGSVLNEDAPEPKVEEKQVTVQGQSQNTSFENTMLQEDNGWTTDSYCYKTKEEAEKHLAEMKGKGEWTEYQTKSFTSAENETLWRVETMGKKAVPTPTTKTKENAWQKDTGTEEKDLYFDTEKEANERRQKMHTENPAKQLRVVPFTLSDKTTVKWKVEKRDGFTIAGDPTGEKIMRVAWTIDDGPSATRGMMRGTTEVSPGKTSGLKGLTNVTWYIQRKQVEDAKDGYEELLARQNEGGEIAIHSFSKTQNHAAWFGLDNAHNPYHAYGTPYAVNSSTDFGTHETNILKDLAEFKSDLSKHQINTHFVRLPGGLTSELYRYGQTLRDSIYKLPANKIIVSDDDIKKIGDNIIAGSAPTDGITNVNSGHTKIANQVMADYEVFKDKLSALDLMEWSGSDDPQIIEKQSWQSETSGDAARNDNTTKKVSDARKAVQTSAGVFEKKIDGMKPGDQRSLVVLAHETTKPDALAVEEDMAEMERLAKENKIKLEYHTMSSLLYYVTGQDVEKIDVNYK